MVYANKIEMTMDIEGFSEDEAPLVTQYDTIELTVNVEKDGQPYDLSDVETVTLAVSRNDGQVVIDRGVVGDNSQVKIHMSKKATHALGTAKMTVQLYDSVQDRVSTLLGFMSVQEDLTGLYTPDDSEQTLIGEVLNDGPDIIEAAMLATGQITQIVDDTAYTEPYNTEATYYKNNIVSFNGNSFMAKKETTGNNPPTDLSTETDNEFWGLIGRKGNDGNGTVATHEELFISGADQTVFSLSSSFDQFQGRTFVYAGGVLQNYGEDYEESTENSITFNDPIPEGVEVTVKYFGESLPVESDLQQQVDGHEDMLNNKMDKGTFSYNIQDFNTAGDGVTDDTAAVRAAVDELKNKGHGKILVPRGDYLIDPAFNFDFSNVIMEGEGRFLASSTSTNFVVLTGSNNTIKGVSFLEGNGSPKHLFVVEGDNNTVDGCKVGYTERSTATELDWGSRTLYVTGDDNTVINCDVYNGSMGVAIANFNNKVLHNHIHDNIMGVRLSASSRDCEVAHNFINRNDVIHDTGADGILASRNVARIHIHDNWVLRSGEHGIYFQGDNSIITNNNVSYNQRSGIKLASYDTQLHWHEGEEQMSPYVGHNNIINDNVCSFNCQMADSDNNAGVYLQSPLQDISASGNDCNEQGHGIRSVFKTDGDTLNGIKVNDNTCERNRVLDIYVVGVERIQVNTNKVDALRVNSDSTNKCINPLIQDNVINETLQITRSTGGIISGNTVKKLLDSVSSENLVLRNNKFTEQDINFSFNFIKIVENCEINLTVDAKIYADSTYHLKSFVNNMITAYQESAYLFRTSGTSATDDLKVIGNTFDITAADPTNNIAQRILRLHGSRMQVANNIFRGSEPDITIEFGGSRSVISGNIAEYSSTQIRAQDGSSGSIITGNLMRVYDTGTSNILANNEDVIV